MESGDIYRVSSARLSSSNIWRNSTLEVFSKSSRDEDDEEALKWAALEKLPTYLRIRRGILTEEEGQAREIDVESLGLIEKRNLLERLVKIAEEDNERFLLRLKERIERYLLMTSSKIISDLICGLFCLTPSCLSNSQCRVGLDMPTIEVRFEHLSIDAETYIGGRALPTMFNFSVNMLEV